MKWPKKVVLAAGLSGLGGGEVDAQTPYKYTPPTAAERIEWEERKAARDIEQAIYANFGSETALRIDGQHIALDFDTSKKADTLALLQRHPQRLIYKAVTGLPSDISEDKTYDAIVVAHKPASAELERFKREVSNIVSEKENAAVTAEQAEKLYALLGKQLLETYRPLLPPKPVVTQEMKAKATKRRFVMCSPDEMVQDVGMRRAIEANYKWLALKTTLEELGCEVIAINGKAERNESPREVFTNGPIFTHKDTAYAPTHDADKVFHSEVPPLAQALKEAGLSIKPVKDTSLNAGTMLYYAPAKTVLIGDNIRNDSGDPIPYAEKDIKAFEQASGLKVVHIPLSNLMGVSDESELFTKQRTHFFDLDTFISPLPGGELLCFPAATTEDGMATLKRLAGNKLIEIGHYDGWDLAANLQTAGRALIMPRCSESLEKTLTAHGYSVITPKKLGLPDDSFTFARGGPHCMTLPIDNPDTVPEAPPVPLLQQLFAAWQDANNDRSHFADRWRVKPCDYDPNGSDGPLPPEKLSALEAEAEADDIPSRQTQVAKRPGLRITPTSNSRTDTIARWEASGMVPLSHVEQFHAANPDKENGRKI